MKRWMQGVAAALCCALALAAAGCGGGEDNPQSPNPSAGRYVEKDITPPGAEGETLHSFLDENGELVCYSQDLTRQYTSADGGENWQEADGPNAGGALEGRVMNCARLAGGDLLVNVSTEEDNRTAGLVRLTSGGEARPYPVPRLDEVIASGETTRIDQLCALSENRLLLGYYYGEGMTIAGPGEAESDPAESGEAGDSEASGIFTGENFVNFLGLVDLESGEVLAEYQPWYPAFAADEDKFYLIDYVGIVEAKALADGASHPAGGGQVAVNIEMDQSLQMAHGPGGLAVLTKKDIQTLDAEGAASVLIDGGSFAFSAIGAMAGALHALPGGEFVVLMEEEDGARLYRYRWDENAAPPASTLKIWSLEESPLVRVATTALRRQNPDVAVEYEVALSEGGGLTAEDAIKALNTRLLGGDGPDVLILDGCPAESYAARGLLQDLGGLVDMGGMFPSIAAPFTGDAGCFYLPAGVKIPVLLGARESLDEADTLASLAEMVQGGAPLYQPRSSEEVFAPLPAEQRPVLAPEHLREVYDVMWDSCGGALITPQGLDTAVLRELLSALADIDGKYELRTKGGMMSGTMSFGYGGGVTSTLSGSPVAYMAQRAHLGAYTANDLYLLSMAMQVPGSEFAAFPGLREGSFVPGCIMGVSAGSAQSELAAQFVNLMLSEEVQAVSGGVGLPVTEAGIQKQIAQLDENERRNPDNADKGFSFDYMPLMNLAQSPQMTDKIVAEMVWNVADSLCQGNTDLEGAVAQIEQELKNYLAERQ